ncbi:hypothetical protein CERZMDRAFT_88845 [Cercospora zeae-maydis SCOH1-5]|uniref:Uncharacterized protein n=1 Tax=Cercospora zeae-maydis SCOH1-5 TaxID=717836 RepID=A0A6A6EZG8_9PEZI|nr:hypothetical protein CERZMDRAFT_88845 [Cercospora zeae-maydis SCOH1-5]
MVRIKSEHPRPTPRQHTPGKGGPLRGKGSGGGGGGGGGGNAKSGGGSNNNPRAALHPALMLSNKKMMEILRCDDVELDMIKHAAYRIMKKQPQIRRQELRTKLGEQEAEYAEMLSGKRWEGLDYSLGGSFETDVDHVLIKIMGIARKKINGEAKTPKSKKVEKDNAAADEGSPTNSRGGREDVSRRTVFKKFTLSRASQSPVRDASKSPSQAEEEYQMSGGLPNDSDDVFQSPTGVPRGVAGVS